MNQEIKRVIFSAPLVANVLDAISKGSTNTLTALDLRHGFFQQSLDERDRHITAFADTSGQIWQYRGVPKCLLNSPLFFHKIMSNILQEVLHNCMLMI